MKTPVLFRWMLFICASAFFLCSIEMPETCANAKGVEDRDAATNFPAVSNQTATPTTLMFDSVNQPAAARLRVAPRLALVIGNDAYRNWGRLHSGRSDAEGIAAALQSRGFQIVGGKAQIDVTEQRLVRLIAEAREVITQHPGAVVAFYFSGHGYVEQSHNMLASIDAGIEPNTMPRVSVTDIARQFAASGAGLTIMFIDACRSVIEGHAAGLIDEPVPDNTFIGYAAQFGSVAGDSGTGSYYTSALRRAFNRSWDGLEDFHLGAAADTIAATRGSQAPVYREGKVMPPVPIRLSAGDPQTVFAVANRQNSQGASSDRKGTLAAQCVASSDLRLIFGLTPAQFNAKLPSRFGPVGRAIDGEYAHRACEAALTAGVRTAAILRGVALTDMIRGSAMGHLMDASWINSPQFTQDAALLAQAADLSDPVADFALGALASGGNFPRASGNYPVDRQVLVRDRFLRAGDAEIPMISAWVGLMLLDLNGQNAQLQQIANLSIDTSRGLKILRQQAERGDQMALVSLFFLRVEPQFAKYVPDGSWLRERLRRAAHEPASPIGVEFNGLTVHESLYLVLLFDTGAGVLGPPDPAGFLMYSLEAEPFFTKLNTVFNRALPPRSLAAMVGCRFITGKNPDDGRTIEGITPSLRTGLHFLQLGASSGDAGAQRVAARVENGDLGKCGG